MTEKERKKRGSAFLRAGIAAVAVLGIGAGITTAAFSNQVTFQADVIAVAVKGGYLMNNQWSPDTGDVVQLPDFVFTSGAISDTNRQYLNVRVKNVSTEKVKLSVGAIQNPDGFVVHGYQGFNGAEIEPGAYKYLTLNVRPVDGFDPTSTSNTAFRIPITAQLAG